MTGTVCVGASSPEPRLWSHVPGERAASRVPQERHPSWGRRGRLAHCESPGPTLAERQASPCVREKLCPGPALHLGTQAPPCNMEASGLHLPGKAETSRLWGSPPPTRDLSWSLRVGGGVVGGGPRLQGGEETGPSSEQPLPAGPWDPRRVTDFCRHGGQAEAWRAAGWWKGLCSGSGTALPGSRAGISWWGSRQGSVAVGPPMAPGRGGGGELRFCPPALLGHFQSPGRREAQSTFPAGSRPTRWGWAGREPPCFWRGRDMWEEPDGARAPQPPGWRGAYQRLKTILQSSRTCRSPAPFWTARHTKTVLAMALHPHPDLS